MTGNAINPVNIRYMTNSPTVIVPDRIDDPPTMIITTPIAPRTSVEKAVTLETPVSDCATFLNSR